MPALQARILKASSCRRVDKETGVELVIEFSTFDLAHVTESFFQIRWGDVLLEAESEIITKEDNVLLKRISSLITLQRQLFIYWRRHKPSFQVIDENFTVLVMPVQIELL